MSTRTKDQRTQEPKEQGAPPQEPGPSPAEAGARQVIGRFLDSTRGDATAPSEALDRNGRADPPDEARPPVAIFCHEAPDSFIGGHVARIVPAMARRGRRVHLFCRHPFAFEESGVRVHDVGPGEEADVLEQVQQFARRASNAFLKEMPAGEPVAVIGYEWTSAAVLSLLKGLRNLPAVLSLHSLERQRSDLSSEISRKVVELEHEGMQAATAILIHDPATAEVARQTLPTCADRIVLARPVFPVMNFESDLDPGAVKARYQVGPVDPVILYVGDLDERYGPDAVLKAMPAILRHHPQARLVIVGDGQLFWPLKVYTRYLLLEHAVRLIGHLQDKPLHELIQASDVVVVPSREATPWWPIQAAWAARKPVVATHAAAKGLTEHEKDSVLIYPSENSVVWGVERVLYDEELRKSIAAAGRKKLEERFGWDGLAEQVEEILSAVSAQLSAVS
jgi:glycosyltransferase involved in cell wall biosynthesis